MRKLQRLAVVVVALLLMGGAIAFAAASGLGSAQATVKKYSAPQPAIKILPIGKPIPKHKHIAIMTCALPICVTALGAATDAAKKIGWSTSSFTNPLTPEGYVAAWQAMIATKPQGIIAVTAFPDTLITSELAEAQADHIPVVEFAPANTDVVSAKGPVIAAFAQNNELTLAGKLMGDIVVNDSGGQLADVNGEPPVAFLWDPSEEAGLGGIQNGFDASLQAVGAAPDVIQVSELDAGKTIPGQIVTYVQSHPDVKYVVGFNCDVLLGVPEALAAANLAAQVKIICRAPSASELSDLYTGGLSSVVLEEDDTGGYRSVDALIRYFLHETNFVREPTGWEQIATANTKITLLDGEPSAPGSPSAFYKAWGIK
jgi:ABC-type sugar transport system substrate-binding protein